MPYRPPEDWSSLLARARAGDREALGDLLDLYRGYLHLLMRIQFPRVLQGKAGPEDLVQETVLQACRELDQFRGTTEKELVGWLQSILASRLEKLQRHYLGTQVRDVRRERSYVEDLGRSSDALAALPASDTSPSGKASARERAVLVAQALAALAEDYREVIVLRHFKGLSFPEIGGRLGRTDEAARALWLRAVRKLRGELEGLG